MKGPPSPISCLKITHLQLLCNITVRSFISLSSATLASTVTRAAPSPPLPPLTARRTPNATHLCCKLVAGVTRFPPPPRVPLATSSPLRHHRHEICAAVASSTRCGIPVVAGFHQQREIPATVESSLLHHCCHPVPPLPRSYSILPSALRLRHPDASSSPSDSADLEVRCPESSPGTPPMVRMPMNRFL